MRGVTLTSVPRGGDAAFPTNVQQRLSRLADEYGSAEATLDLFFLAYLLEASRFGFFTFGPITIDVRVVEDLVARNIVRAKEEAPAGRPGYSDDALRFLRTLSQEVERSGRRRIDELHFLIAFMKTNEGVPARVFPELGITVEQVVTYVPNAKQTERKLYSPEEAADYLGVHVKTVRNWIRSGRLPASRLAGQRVLRIRASDLERVLEPVDPSNLDA